MTRRRPIRVRRRRGLRGQIIVLFALCLVAIIGMAGVLVDGGLAWSNQRQTQAAADTGALAAAQSASSGGNAVQMALAARSIALTNGVPKDLVDCAGVTRANQGVIVNRPPLTGPNLGKSGFVEVITNRAMRTSFAGAVGFSCWIVSARAVASIKSSAVATCNFCATSTGGWNHVFLLDNGADLRVDGDVYINGPAGVSPMNTTTCHSSNPNPTLAAFVVCGDAFDLKHSGGATATAMSAKSISVVGGWETHGGSVAQADQLAPTCPYHFEPPGYAALTPVPVGNVCVGVQPLADPLNDLVNPGNIINPPDPATMSIPQPNVNGCVAKAGTTLKIPPGTFATPNKLVIQTAGAYTICPGLYYGGFMITEHFNPSVYMVPGVYFMAGGGFTATHGTSIDGSGGVMIYNSGEAEAFSSSTSPGQDLVPACDPAAPSACIKPTIIGGGNGLSASANNIAPNTNVTYTFTIQGTPAKGSPTGTMTFYDGDNVITGCLNKAVTAGVAQRATATWTTQYPLFGNRAISAVYVQASCRTAVKCYGDANYAPVGANLPAPGETIKPQPKGAMDNFQVVTTGQVLLSAPTSNPYSGVLIFQDRTSGLSVTISSGSGLGACPANFMTAGVSPPNPLLVPAPCGQLGGLSGTIYAPHQGPDLATSATVNLEGSGLANLQIIAAQISLNTTDQNVRFAYRPEVFANGKIHLVE